MPRWGKTPRRRPNLPLARRLSGRALPGIGTAKPGVKPGPTRRNLCRKVRETGTTARAENNYPRVRYESTRQRVYADVSELSTTVGTALNKIGENKGSGEGKETGVVSHERDSEKYRQCREIPYTRAKPTQLDSGPNWGILRRARGLSRPCATEHLSGMEFSTAEGARAQSQNSGRTPSVEALVGEVY